jgi:3-(3-hydroxy-phenyl)propionate hydroxylase
VFEGAFEDRFPDLRDIKMPAGYPAERWFWFDPPFNPGQSALLHKQPDDIWRIDLQLGWDADPVEERKPERVRPRLRRCWARTGRSSSSGSASTLPVPSACRSSSMAA